MLYKKNLGFKLETDFSLVDLLSERLASYFLISKTQEINFLLDHTKNLHGFTLVRLGFITEEKTYIINSEKLSF